MVGTACKTKRHTNATLYFAFAAADSSYFMLVHGVFMLPLWYPHEVTALLCHRRMGIIH